MRDNRDLKSRNREFSARKVSVHFSHTCLVEPQPRFVLTDKFAGEEDGDVERDRVAGALRRGVLAGAS
jgi:hypothetical protein